MFGQAGKYALRIMATFVTAKSQKTWRAKDLAPVTGIPSAYLSKVLQRLTEAGLLSSQKGHRGGFQLNKAPKDIRLIDILTAVDAAPKRDLCAFGWGECNPANPCPLHPVWTSLSSNVMKWAESTTLDNIATQPPPEA